MFCRDLCNHKSGEDTIPIGSTGVRPEPGKISNGTCGFRLHSPSLISKKAEAPLLHFRFQEELPVAIISKLAASMRGFRVKEAWDYWAHQSQAPGFKAQIQVLHRSDGYTDFIQNTLHSKINYRTPD